jgi:curved DNA-binding protein CbpA
MDAEKDYYSILGVLPSIDGVALAAVHRALLKKYHPDVFKGSNSEAERRTKEFNEAYEVLGNPNTRRAYDNARKNSGFGSYQQEEPNSPANDVTADWELVKKYHPETEARRIELNKLSRSLAFAFQITVLEKKLSSNAYEIDTIATKMKSEFLERYFGKDPDIQRFAHEALIEGRTDVAKEVNRAITVLGTPLDARRFIRQVQNSMKYTGSRKYNARSVDPAEFYRSVAVSGVVIVASLIFILFVILLWSLLLAR